MKDWFHLLEAQFRGKCLHQAHGGTSLFSAYHSGTVGRYPQVGALFYTTPKNASSAVHLLLMHAEGLVGREELQNPDFPVYDRLVRLGPPHRMIRYQIARRDKKNLLKFSFVRNPFERLLSFYADKIAHPDVPYLEKSLRKFHPDVDFLGMEFRDLVRFAHRLPHVRMEPHLLPQHYFFRPQKMDFIGRCENFARDIERLASLLAPEVREKIVATKLPRLKRSEHRHYTEYYDDKTRRLAQQIYARDLELFGYRFGA